MRSRFIQSAFVVSMLAFPALGARQPDANRVTYQLATGENGVQLKVYGIETRRRDQAQHRLCYADFDPTLPVAAPLPQLAAALNASPLVFATLVGGGRVGFPAPALANAKLEDGKLQLIPTDSQNPVMVEACTRTDLLNFGPQVHGATPQPGWTCTATLDAEQTLTFQVRQSSLDHLRASARIDRGDQRQSLADWDSVSFSDDGGEWAFEGRGADAEFRLVGKPAANGFDARLDLTTPQQQFHNQAVHCQQDPQS